MSNKGSLWKIWDLHVHSPATYGGEYSTFIDNLKASRADVIGINDYCSVDGYKNILELGGAGEKVLFPVIEFRMHNILNTRKNPNGIKINFHVIFDNDPKFLPKIANWLNSLKCFKENGHNTLLGNVENLCNNVSFDFRTVVDSLKELGYYRKQALVWLPYDEYGGIDEIDPVTDGYFKAGLLKNTHIIGSSTKKQIDFFKWQAPKFSEDEYKQWFDIPRPCIKGSDAHKINYPFGQLKNHQSQPVDKYCWIKAEMTFEGLKQILIEPDRVFIGQEPSLITRERENQTKFLESLLIKKKLSANIDDVWFEDFLVSFNSGLVAIIGNKGNGKSAITDIVSLCANTHQDPIHFSFLTSSKFRKLKPYNLSEKFEATLTWKDGSSATKGLNENPDNNQPKRVKYIPQNFLEKLCTNIEINEFEKELKQIIYSHTPNDRRLGKSSLDELIFYRSNLINKEIDQIQTKLNELNQEIILLEEKYSLKYRKRLENSLELKQEELKVHLSIKPQKPDISPSSDEDEGLLLEINKIREKTKKIEEDIDELKSERSILSIKQEELKKVIHNYQNLDRQLKKAQQLENEYVQILLKNGINQNDVFSYTINVSKVTDLLSNIEKKLSGIENELNLNTETSQVSKLKELNTQLQEKKEDLNKPAKALQKYLDDLKKWEYRKKELEGDETDEGSLKFYEEQLLFIKKSLIPKLNSKYDARRSLTKELYSKKLDLIKIRRELFQPVLDFIDDFKELKERYDVKVDVSLKLIKFSDSFFNFINQGRTGTFCGKEEGYKMLANIIETALFTTAEGYLSFAEELLDNLKYDKRGGSNTPIDNIATQLKSGISISQLYNFIYKGDYLKPVFNLKLGDKTLQELSPGERGALLLIFYLILDNDDIPLIIDQPEENLDNESVYHILVHFIKKAKEKRQIIIVTHNPNLAIVCDADQIINMKIEKENKNTVKFISGAIENSMINKAIVNILEGTLPAFNNRDSKYLR